jgi:hypothetical protein
MKHDSGSQSDYEDWIEEIQAVISGIKQIIQMPPVVHTPGELEEFEQRIEQMTKQLAGLTTGLMLQNSLDSEEMRHDARQFVGNLSRPMRHDGMEDEKWTPLVGQLSSI